jgi:outer membrane protein assembly factor BamA
MIFACRFCFPIRILIFIGFLLLVSCKATKYVPADKYLLTQNVIKVDSKELKEKDFEQYLKQKPNKKILNTFRFHLGLYNFSKPGSEKWISRTLRKIGEEPVVYDFVQTDRTRQQMGLFLSNMGYYNSTIKDSVVFKNRDAKVFYIIKTGEPYRINKIVYNIEDSVINKLVLADTSKCLIKPGSNFNFDLLENERTRIEALLRNQHYFNFTKDYIFCELDSVNLNHLINLTISIRKFQVKDIDGNISTQNHSQYKIGNIQVWIENRRSNDSFDYNLGEKAYDIVSIDNVEYIFRDQISIKPKLIANNIYISENNYYSQKDIDQTYRSLSSLRIFKFVNINFIDSPEPMNDSVKWIDCKIQLSTIEYQSYQTDAELTSISGIGIGGIFNYQHRNTFKGAEIFNLKFKGATEARKSDKDLTFKSTVELGTEASLLFPKFMLPFRSEQFTREYNPQTSLSMSYNYMQRITYTHRIVSVSYGYQWKGKSNNAFTVKPLNINYIKISNLDSAYYKSISKTYLQYSFRDHLIASTEFTYTYNNQKGKKNIKYQNANFNFESAGNSSRLFMNLMNRPSDASGSYEIYNIKYAQYVRFDINLCHYNPVNTTDKIVFRFFAGVAYPYGNSKTMPFEKQYYAGGAYSIRAWSIRSLGPGSFKETVPLAYPDKASDLKIEGNIEYRFKLIWKLEGAMFVDIGNIWAINKEDTRPGARFEPSTFINQLAVGSGIGTRFDFNYFILRLDFGIKLRDPAEDSGYRWFFNTNPASNISFIDRVNPVIGIGYPF